MGGVGSQVVARPRPTRSMCLRVCGNVRGLRRNVDHCQPSFCSPWMTGYEGASRCWVPDSYRSRLRCREHIGLIDPPDFWRAGTGPGLGRRTRPLHRGRRAFEKSLMARLAGVSSPNSAVGGDLSVIARASSTWRMEAHLSAIALDVQDCERAERLHDLGHAGAAEYNLGFRPDTHS